MLNSAVGALAALTFIISPAATHSWVERLMVIDSQGTFTGNPGYARNNTLRTAPGFSDPVMVHILPTTGQPTIEQRDLNTTGIQPTDPMCKATQQEQIQSDGSPRLQAAPGDYIALIYEENGHVTLPQNQIGKPPNRGTVYIYGTTQPKPDEKFLDVFEQWTADGSGGDRRGVLLATQNFDDGRCYQVNSGNISTARQAQYPHTADKLSGADLDCQNDIAIPLSAPTGQPYVLFWVWSWPTLPGIDPNLPNGKAEVYTTCIDVDIIANGTKATRDLQDRAVQNADLGNQAIPKYMQALAASASQTASAATASSDTSQTAASPTQNGGAATNQPTPTSGSSTAGVTVTVTQSATPVTITISPSTLMTQASGSALPPSALNIQAPANASASQSTGAVAGQSSVSALPTFSLPSFSGTATPLSSGGISASYQNASASTVMSASCNKCKKQKRSKVLGSKIFGAAAHHH